MRNIVFVLVLLTSFAKAQVNLNSSLTACYALNGSASEPVNAYTGTLGAVTSTVDRFSNSNSAYAFSGTSSSYIQLPGNSFLKPTNGLSFSAWVKPGTLSSPEYIVFTKNNTSSNFESYALVIASVSGGYKFRVHKGDGSGNTSFVDGTTLISAGTWYHVAFTMDNSNIAIYLNGALQATVSTTYSFNYQSGKDVFLGGTNESIFNGPYVGSMDNVRFYNRVLSSAEISSLYSTDPSCIAPPVSSFSVFPSTVCPGKPVVLTDLSTNSPSSWSWQIPGSTTPTASINNPTVTFANPGTYVVSMTSTNSGGASNTSTQSIVVLPLPNVTILSTPTVCMGSAFNLIAGGAASYTWSSNQTGSVQVVFPTANTSFSVVGTGTNGCVNYAATTVTVFPLPVVQVSGSGTVCLGSSTSLLASGAVNYAWGLGAAGGNTIATGNIITISPTISTIYRVSGWSAQGCKDSVTQAVNVIPLPQVSVYASDSSVCLGSTLTLSGAGANTYSWTGGVTNGVPFYPSASASYTVTGTASNGCKNTNTIQIVVNPTPTVIAVTSQQNVCSGASVTLTAAGAVTYSWSNGVTSVSVVVSPLLNTNYTVTGMDNNGCKTSYTLIQTVDACLGLKNVTGENEWKVYPNPTSGRVVVEGVSTGVKQDLELVDISGKVLFVKKEIEPGKITVDLSEFQKGIYFLRITSDGQFKTIQLLKE